MELSQISRTTRQKMINFCENLRQGNRRLKIHIRGCKWLIFYSNTSFDMTLNILDAQKDHDKKVVTKKPVK